jgi:hypothetical protein
MQLKKTMVFSACWFLIFLSSSAFGQQWGDFTYTVSGSDNITITGYTCPGGTAVIPDTIDGKSVVRIGAQAFFQCAGLTGVTIPSSITSIGYAAFNGCIGLTGVTIPDSVTVLEQGAFYGCTGLTSVTIGNGVTSIGFDAFNGCTGLTSISIPGSVTIISGAAFLGCTGLTSVTMPASVTSMGDSVFYNCTGLTSVTISGSLTSIPTYTFFGCTSLTSVTIPASITNIGDAAFFQCTALSAVYFNGNAPTMGEHIFRNSASNLIIYYNAGSTGFDNPWCLPNNPCYSTVFCTDFDHDGYFSEGGGCGVIDCNDNNSAINPAASDVNCDGIDNNCNGTVDDGYVPDSSCFLPGACAAGNAASSCSGGVVTPCATGIPSSDANCDGIDNNCDAQTDEGYVSVQTSCGVGACAATGSTSCVLGGVVESCTPGNSTAEVCNGIDDDCNGEIDNGLIFKNYYQDADNDTYGNADNATVACKEPDGFVDNSSGLDCNDTDSAMNPEAAEMCGDGIDNNCDGQIDENCATDNCTDTDGDGYFAGEGCMPADCDDSDWKSHEGCDASSCSLKMVPKQISKLVTFFEPVIPFVITADRKSGVDFGTFSVSFMSDAIHPIIRAKISKRIIIGLYIVNPFKVVKGETTVEVEIYGYNPETRCANFTVK